MDVITVDRRLDCRNMMYPIPILKAEQALAEMSAGQVLEVQANDANTKPDLETWALGAGCALVRIADEDRAEYRFYVRKAAAPTAQAVTMRGGENLFLVVLKSNTPSQVRAAFMYASLAAAMGQDTVVYCVQEGADAAMRDAAQKDTSPAGEPTITSRLSEALEMGVRIEVCEQTASVRNIHPEDLIPDARLIGGAALIDYAIRARGTLTF